MDETRTRRLEAVMERMANDDVAAVWTLANEFQDELRGAAGHQLVSMGRRDLLADDDFNAGLVIDVALLLFGTSAWRPGGALPWVWAQLAIRQLVGQTVGHRSTSVDERQAKGSELASESVVCAPDMGLEQLAVSNGLVSKLRKAISMVGSLRDQQVHIDYQTQRADGDPSPSHTVAKQHGLSPPNVRQIDRRMRLGLQCLAETDSEFTELKDLPWIA